MNIQYIYIQISYIYIYTNIIYIYMHIIYNTTYAGLCILPFRTNGPLFFLLCNLSIANPEMCGAKFDEQTQE